MGIVYDKVMEFKKKYPGGITWHRLEKHCKVIEDHLNPGEAVLYVFVGQKNEGALDFFQTAVFALTNKRILIGQKRVAFGYFLNSITPDLFNDLSVYKGLIWGKVTIDTVKETIHISNLSKKSIYEIETEVSEYMMREKKKWYQEQNLPKE